jgi:hypothetical protein
MIDAILDMSKNIIYLKEDDKEDAVKKNLVGGRIQYYDKINMLSTIYDFFQVEFKKKSGKYYDVAKRDFINGIVPGFAEYLSDFIIRLCSNPQGAIQLPRLVDSLIYEVLIENEQKQIIPPITDLDKHDVMDLALDFVTFAERSNIIDESIKSGFLSTLETTVGRHSK